MLLFYFKYFKCLVGIYFFNGQFKLNVSCEVTIVYKKYGVTILVVNSSTKNRFEVDVLIFHFRIELQYTVASVLFEIYSAFNVQVSRNMA